MSIKITEDLGKEIILDYQNGKRIRDIASKNNLNPVSIRRFLKRSNIPIFKGTTPYNLEIKNDLKQLLIGSLLGDGCFCSLGGRTKNMCLSIAHSEKQKEYLQYKWEILNKYKLVSPIVKYHINNKRYTHELVGYRFRSKLHPIFTNIRLKYYDSNGHKRVFKEFVKDIDALGLSIWYMDDGYVTKNSCILSTCSFTLEEQSLLADILLNKFGLHFNVGKNDNSMYLQAKDFPKFVDLIKGYVIPSMQYKLITYRERRVLHKQGELLEQLNESISSQATKEHKSM